MLNQTLDESFSLHIDLALAAGAGDEQVRAVLLLIAEYRIAKAWGLPHVDARIQRHGRHLG